jgi:hypothetical protein
VIWTNRAQLPVHLTRILIGAWEKAQSDYTKGRPGGPRTISVTQLIAPPQKVRLERENADELTMDVLDTVPALRGTALHYILELAGREAATLVPEERLTTEFQGWTITGKSDLYETEAGRLCDFKDSSVWAYVFGKPEWDAQLNVLRWLRVRNGGFVGSLEVDLFVGDRRRGESKRDAEYPPRVVVMPVTMWTLEETERYVVERLALHGAETPPACSPTERWTKTSKYAVKKLGAKKATKIFETKDEAEMFALSLPGYVEDRPGESTRCMDYCAGSPFCPQWKADPTNPANAGGTE